MRKEFVVKRIDMSPDGAPHVIVSLASARDFQGAKSQFDTSKLNPANMNDMMKDLNKMLLGIGGGMAGGTTLLKMDIREYKEMNLSVGDKVYLDLTTERNFGV